MDWIILIAAAFGAGVLNTIAGGRTFLTFPALVLAGLPQWRQMQPLQLRCCLAIYVLGLWAIRNHFGGFGRRGVILPISGLTLIAAAYVGAQPWTIAIILTITLGLRIKLQETQ